MDDPGGGSGDVSAGGGDSAVAVAKISQAKLWDAIGGCISHKQTNNLTRT